jgi:hypothetical protein
MEYLQFCVGDIMWNFNKMYKYACGDRDEFMIREFARAIGKVAPVCSMKMTLVVNLKVWIE